MTKDKWITRVEDFIGEIDRDDDLQDDDYLEVMDELAGRAQISADAKREGNLDFEGDDE